MKFDFLLCGSPDDAFYSQFSLFRRSLDALGGDYRDARLVGVFGAAREVPLPERWKRYFDRIEIAWADCDEYRRVETYAQGDLRYELVRPDADLAFLCDADTLMLRPFPDDFLAGMTQQPAISAVIAHYPLPIGFTQEELGKLSVDSVARSLIARWPSVYDAAMRFPGLRRYLPLTAETKSDDVWEILGRDILGRSPDMAFGYTLQTPESRQACPFYVNYGFVAGTPAMLVALHGELRRMQPHLAERIGKSVGFYGQAAIALAVQKLGLPHRALPMRFNYPNDPLADRLYPEELANVVLLHYLRTTHFDRHRIFSIEEEFRRFLSLDLSGSDRVFQQYVRELTGGTFPFSGAV